MAAALVRSVPPTRLQCRILFETDIALFDNLNIVSLSSKDGHFAVTFSSVPARSASRSSPAS
jgi:hypothetical protein